MNLIDMECAKAGYDIATKVHDITKKKSDTENLITKSLGVLQEDGVYAFFLYLASLNKAAANEFSKQMVHLLRTSSATKDILREKTDVLMAIRDDFASNLVHLLLAKEMLERALVYARYHAKAFPANKDKNNNKAEEGVL